MHLGELVVGQRARIVAIVAGDKLYRQKLVAMGLIPGTEFTLSRVAPLGDPVEIHLRGFALSLRKEEASILDVEAV